MARGEQSALVEIIEAEGSTPREKGALMLVSAEQSFGTIGGGQLEFHAIDKAREMLDAGGQNLELLLHLGPHMGQCCGGRVKLKLWRAGAADLARLSAAEARSAEKMPQIQIFGAGHTGKALARQLALLPFKTQLIDEREEVFFDFSGSKFVPEAQKSVDFVQKCPEKSAFVVLTHSHALDYAITQAALKRGDAAYVGMIGSATKRARFASWFLASGGTAAQLSKLTCPIGGADVIDKRPEIIAALTVAELIRVFAG